MKTTNWPPRSVCPLKTRQIKYRFFFFFLSLPCQNVRLRTHKEFAVSSGFDKTNSRELLRFASHTREKKKIIKILYYGREVAIGNKTQTIFFT